MIEFDLHILHLPPIHLWNINLYDVETHREKAMRTELPERKLKEGNVEGEGKIGFIRGVLGNR